MRLEEHAKVREAFDRYASALARSAFHQDELRARRLLHFADLPHGARVLDVGCGAGPILHHLSRGSARAFGVDLSRAMLDHARESRAAVLQAAGETLPFRDGAFDAVVTRATLRHVPAPDAALQEMRRVLDEDGVLVVEDVLSHVDGRVALRHNEIERLRDPSHQRILSVGALTSLLEEAGFEIQAAEVVVHERELEEWLEAALAPEPARAEIRRRFERDLGEQRLGLRSRRADGRILFDLRHAMVKGVKR